MRWAGRRRIGSLCRSFAGRLFPDRRNLGVFSFRISRFMLDGSHGDPNFGPIHTFLLGRGRKTADGARAKNIAKGLFEVWSIWSICKSLKSHKTAKVFLWKSLGETGRYLEMFSEKAWRLGNPPRGCPGRDGMWPRSPSTAGGAPRPATKRSPRGTPSTPPRARGDRRCKRPFAHPPRRALA